MRAADEALAALRAKRAGMVGSAASAPGTAWAEDVEGDPHEVANPMLELLREMLDRMGEVGGWRDDPAPESAPASPLTTWLQVAKALGVDDSTLRALRKRAGDRTEACFAGMEEARTWYRAVKAKARRLGGAGESRPKTRRRGGAAKVIGCVVDWDKVKV